MPEHECDLFLFTSHSPYFVDRTLPRFAQECWLNPHGWGIGFYTDGKARVVRSEERAAPRGVPSREFVTAANSIASPVILGHVRWASIGSVRPENNHPFCLNFLGYDWLLIHNGTSGGRIPVRADDRLLGEATNDSARVFEFIRRRMIDYCGSSPMHSLTEACSRAYSALLREDPLGTYNIILSNGHLTFAFLHHRQFYVLNRLKVTGDVAVISTERLTAEPWVQILPPAHRPAKMLVFSGPTLVLNRSVGPR